MEATDVQHVETSVLIIGAGAAGLRVAIELADQEVPCLVLGKREHGDAHTVMAAGGINASLGSRDPEDSWKIHAADTLREGHFVCDPVAVELLARHAPDRVRELQRWGCDFNRTEDGEIDQRYFGAQAFRRTCFVGDRTGRAILETLVDRARERKIPYRQDVYVTDILLADGKAGGAMGFDLHSGRPYVFHARAVVLAAGGYTSCYSRGTSRTDENTGDAPWLAFRAGCALRDMEFVQFHPTGMVHPKEVSGRLVTEAVRGEGGRLFNREGERFMERYSPEAMELDARDVVARAIARELEEGRGTEHGGVLLDVSHEEPEHIRERLPRVVERFAEYGKDITEEPMEVAPTAHYAMGGVRVDFETGATGVPNLYAVGEATAGVHGANRLGGNSLAETVVFGQITGAHIAKHFSAGPTPRLPDSVIEKRLGQLSHLRRGGGRHEPHELIQELRQTLWDSAGIVRSEESLRKGYGAIRSQYDKADSLHVEGVDDFVEALNFRAMLLVATCILKGSLARKESRGAHYREDHPEERSDQRCALLYQTDPDGNATITHSDVPEPNPEIQKTLDEDYHLDYHHLE